MCFLSVFFQHTYDEIDCMYISIIHSLLYILYLSYIDISQFILSPVDLQEPPHQILVIYKAAMNIQVQIFGCICAFILLDKYLVKE